MVGSSLCSSSAPDHDSTNDQRELSSTKHDKQKRLELDDSESSLGTCRHVDLPVVVRSRSSRPVDEDRYVESGDIHVASCRAVTVIL